MHFVQRNDKMKAMFYKNYSEVNTDQSGKRLEVQDVNKVLL